MSDYIEYAAQANKIAKSLLKLVASDWKTHSTKEEFEGEVSCYVAQLVNLGTRCNPRLIKNTLRFSAVQKAVEGLPVKVTLEKVTNPRSGFTSEVVRAIPKKHSLNLSLTEEPLY